MPISGPMRRWNVLVRLRTRATKGEEGFTIIEMMVALTIFAVVMTAVASMLGSSLITTGNNRNRSVAANVAAEEMEIVRATPFAQLPVGQVTSTQIVDGVLFTVTRDSEWITQDANSGACDAASGEALAFLRIDVKVSWPQMSGVAPATSHTVITPPVGAYDPNSGHLAVSVRDRDAAPQDAVPVTITGPVNKTEWTTTDGCAFFAYLPTGAYTVALSSPGYVDGQGKSNPTQTATVQVGATVPVSFDYDRAASLDLTLQAPGGGVPPDGLPITLGNTHLLPSETKLIPGAPGVTRLVGNLFPYVDGYQVWTGDCSDADPEGLKSDGSPYYPGASRDLALAVTPGSVTPGTATLQRVRVRVLDGGGNPVVGAVVKVHHFPDQGPNPPNPPDPICGYGQDYTLPGVTDLNGRVTSALPFGNWLFKVSGRVPQGSWPTGWIQPPASPGSFNLTVDVQ
jgi:prepilin-type N-terminal cleavage/methylation domain-containing protein